MKKQIAEFIRAEKLIYNISEKQFNTFIIEQGTNFTSDLFYSDFLMLMSELQDQKRLSENDLDYINTYLELDQVADFQIIYDAIVTKAQRETPSLTLKDLTLCLRCYNKLLLFNVVENPALKQKVESAYKKLSPLFKFLTYPVNEKIV